jgi:3-methyladenine DNA glycosylase AlkD
VPADRALIDDLRAQLAARADPAKAPDMQAYMKSAMPFYGVQKPARDAIVRAAPPLTDLATWRDTILALWREATRREERYLAIAIAVDPRHRAHRTIAELPLYEELIVTGAWWDHVDAVATVLLAELLDREPEAIAPVLRRWARDAEMWKRRAAIVAQVRRKARTDVALLYDCIEPNRGDGEFFIRKGIGWALRAYAWIDPDEIERYCATHELSALSRREALRNVAGAEVTNARRLPRRAPPAPRRRASSATPSGSRARRSRRRR